MANIGYSCNSMIESPAIPCAPVVVVWAGTMGENSIDEWSQMSSGALDFISLELTPKCNLRCLHCYADSSPYRSLEGTMTYEDWKKVLVAAKERRCRKVQFIGGEPTLHPHFVRLLKFANELSYEFIEVFTNGTVLKDNVRLSLSQVQPRMAFSIYSPNPATHDTITQLPGSYLKTLRSIAWALQTGLDVRVALIVMEENKNDTEVVIEKFEKFGVSTVTVHPLQAVGRATSLAPESGETRRLCGRCGMGMICVTAAGEILPCVFARGVSLGNVRDGFPKHLAKGLG